MYYIIEYSSDNVIILFPSVDKHQGSPTKKLMFNPFTPELKKCILPTFQKAIVWVM